MNPRFVSLVLGGVFLSACSAHSGLPIGPASFPAAPVDAPKPADLNEYQIGPRDVLMVSVFNEPGLSFDQLPVSAGGNISMPLIGSIPAAGRTPTELATAIDAKLNARFLRNARTAVSVVTATNYTVTIDGAVNKPGIYTIPGRLMLSQALALADGAADFAKLNEVIVVREINGQRYAARFDLNDVRSGEMPDLQLQQSDTVIVGLNSAARLFSRIVTTLPSAAAVFVALR